MVVAIHRTDSGSWSFQRQGASETLLIQAPSGSELLPTSLGAFLFIPGPDRLVRLGLDAADVVRELRAGRFRVV